MTRNEVADFRPLNVTLAPVSDALSAYSARAGISDKILASGFDPRPDLDLEKHPGRTISDLTYINCFLGGTSAWSRSDRTNIDRALEDAMTDAGLQQIIAQYYDGPITSKALRSQAVDAEMGQRFFKDNAEQLVSTLAADLLGDADPDSTVINLMLPEGIVLVDGNSDGSDADEEDEHMKPVLVDNEAADSTQGLGGYHGSVPHHGGGAGFIYYAVGVYSKGHNGIPAFDEPWKNVVATFYHELVEARTDPDVEDVIRTRNMNELGWYSPRGGEIGDIPMALAGRDLSLVMKEIELRNGRKTPIQLMWSNHDHGPAEPTKAAAGATA